MPNVFESGIQGEDDALAMDAEGYTPPIGPPPDDGPRHVSGAQRIVAVFKGQPGSMGFEYNKRYNLIISGSSIRKLENGPWVPYGSLEAFFNNWIVTGSH